MAGVKLRTRVSTKGQVVLPRAVRDQPGFQPGSELEVNVAEGVVTLTPVQPHRSYSLDDLIGIAGYSGPPISIEDMERAIEDEVHARRARGRY